MHRNRSFHVASLIVLLSMLQAASLRAQPADPNAAAAEYRKAYAAMAKEDWPTAREILLTIWKTSKTYDVASSLGQVEFKLAHYGSAARFMAFALEHVAPSEKPEFIQRLKNGLRELRLRVGAIRVAVNEPGAEIIVGDDVLGTSPLAQEVFLDPGKHVLIARKDGRIAKADVLAKAGEAFDVTMTLPAEPAPTSGLGFETSSVTPSADAPGVANSVDPPRPSIIPVVVGGAVVVASLATGIGLRISANGSYEDADDLRKQNGPYGCVSSSAAQADCDAQAEANRSGDSKANVSTVAFTIAGGALLATAAYWFWPRDTSARAGRANVRLLGSASPKRGFLGISYDF
jgi:hypothetical protein